MAARVIWGSLCLLRVLWCLLPQTGYIHPDEFFQSPEVMAEDILGVQATRPWEFYPSSSCRTVVFPLLTSGSAFWLLKLWEELGPWPGLVSGYVLLVGPRLLLTALSFTLDWGMYHLAPRWGADRWNALALLSGSYVTLVFYTRTFSNSIEGLLFTGLLVLVSPRVAWTPTPKKPAPGPWWHSWLLGAIVAAGFFNRPTFLAFALVPLFLWGIHRTLEPGFKALTHEALVLLPGAALAAVLFVATDSWYFSNLSRSSSLVLTPVNFLHYNLDPQNLARHGTHVRLTHLAVNGFLLFGILHAQALQAAWQQLQVCLQTFTQIGLPSAPSTQGLLSSSRSCLLLLYLTPLVLLSAFSHQEARFLIPLIVPLILLCSPQTQPVPWKGTLVLFNALGALFFGCLHQGGLVPGLKYLEQVVHAPGLPGAPTHYTLLFAHTYMPPQHLLHLSGPGSPVEVVDMGGSEDWVLCQALNNFTRQPACQLAGGPWFCRLFVVTPGTNRQAVERCSFPLKNETLLFPHLTLEDPPALSSLLNGTWRNHLSLHIIELEEMPNMSKQPLLKPADISASAADGSFLPWTWFCLCNVGGLLKALRSDSYVELSEYRDQHFRGDNEEQEKLLKKSCTLYVGNLSFYTTEEQIYELFSKSGDIKKIIMGLDKMKKTACGFCFVEYYSRADAENAMRYINGTRLDDRIIRTDWDAGFKEGRQYGRGDLGARYATEVRDEYREDYDAGRGGYGKLAQKQ